MPGRNTRTARKIQGNQKGVTPSKTSAKVGKVDRHRNNVRRLMQVVLGGKTPTIRYNAVQSLRKLGDVPSLMIELKKAINGNNTAGIQRELVRLMEDLKVERAKNQAPKKKKPMAL